MRLFAVVRWLLAAGTMVFCVRQMGQALKIEGYGAAPHLFLAIGALIATAILISPETVVRAGELFSRLFTSAILPDEKNRKPPLSYLLARRYGEQMRLPEAIEEYAMIIHYYPDEEDAYRELVAAALEAGEGKLARKYIRLFERRFHSPFPPALPPPE